MSEGQSVLLVFVILTVVSLPLMLVGGWLYRWIRGHFPAEHRW